MAEAMTPLRALTIALAGAISSVDFGGSRLAIAEEALVLARAAIDHLPEGWAIVDEAKVRSELEAVDQRLHEIEGTSRLLLAFRILQDGHAKTLGAAGRIADDRDRVHELYPDMPARP